MTAGYPIANSGPLDPAPKRGVFGLGRRYRDGSDVPKADAHQVLVYRVNGDYLLDRARLGLSDEQVVNATHVSVVDMRRAAPILVELPIPSRDASDFTMRVTFICTVTDPLTVVREGIDAATILAAYLKSHHRIFELGLDFVVGDINDVRRNVNAQVTAYVTVKPPIIPGLSATMASVEVLTPQELVKVEEDSRALRRTHRLEAERQRLDQTFETGTELRNQELQDLRSRYQRDTEYEQLQHDQLITTERQRHGHFLEAERGEFRRRELGKAMEMLREDPKEALQKAYLAGQLDAYLTGQSDAAEFGEQFRAERDRDRALEAAQEDRDQEHRLQRKREKREDRLRAVEWEREDRMQAIAAEREDKRWAHEDEQHRSELDRQDQLQKLLWQRDDMLRRETEGRKDNWRRLELNLEVLKVLASRGHADMVNLPIERIVDELAPGSKAEQATDAPSALAGADEDGPPSPADREPDPETEPEPDADVREEDDAG